ncbi:hypothetical protein CERSUDRAFT_163673 [Gelatoporia subvermispora B]|uniref:DUS-like FMN-binding domain-containing protein n=1 Tax=Ceriporiopsis subvermispora (strain B) TaxID=914234 RepID=M2QWH0_CERS8|nr:hypothetical protein CERSUDRAFT_163673 [Gelatoporia subvermispora B]
MSRRSRSPSPGSERLAKRPRLEYSPLTPEDYKNGVVLAPMVRSGALPTRLFALKHGASLVWGPETIDKALLHTTRTVDPDTGFVSYNGKSKAIFTTHPIEKPYLIFQLGSADPEIAVQAAKMVMDDVAGIDLNCGCPKPFSTHGGMGAALLTNPDLLCGILSALRQALPPHISVSAKIRLLPSQEDTLKLVERIVNTGISCLTVHCRTRNQRMREAAQIERLREIVQFVEGMGRGIAVIENGDCLGWEDAKRVREVTGAHSAMIATAAEANPTCFSPRPLADLELTFIPNYIRLSKYIKNHWASTKFCTSQFKGAHLEAQRADLTRVRKALMSAKSYEDMDEYCKPWNGEEEWRAIVDAIEARGGRPQRSAQAMQTQVAGGADASSAQSQPQAEPSSQAVDSALQSQSRSTSSAASPAPSVHTPPNAPLEADPLLAPRAPMHTVLMPVPPLVSSEDAQTPTPAPASSGNSREGLVL